MLSRLLPKRRVSILVPPASLAVMAFLLMVHPVMGQATEPQPEKKVEAEPAKPEPGKPTAAPSAKEQYQKDSVIKIDGVIFTGYEWLNHENNGAADASGPVDQKTGFRVDRAYVNVHGNVKEGQFKGWGARVTADAAPSGTLNDGCASTCTRDNTPILLMKYGYINMPIALVPGLSLRLGQQQIPIVDAQAGIATQGYWAHRFVAVDPWEDMGIASSTDRGLGIVQKADYFGIHLLFGNGEGFKKNNAQGFSVSSTPTLANLSSGNTDSHGLDLYGSLAVKPTGANKEFELAITLPFRLQNITGMDPSETAFTAADISTPASPKYAIYKGDERAKRDFAYGLAVDAKVTLDGIQFTVGAGQAIKVDRRANAYKYAQDDAGFGTVAAVGGTTTAHLAFGEDSRGRGDYVYAHARMGWVGAFARVIQGTVSSNTSLSGRVETPDGRSWASQALGQDALDGTLGNMPFSSFRNIDQGKGRYRSILAGVEFFPTPAFSIAVGMSELTGTKANGSQFKVNGLQRVGNAGTTATTNLSDQVGSSTPVKGALGYSSTETVDPNDFIGEKQANRQVFIRAQILY